MIIQPTSQLVYSVFLSNSALKGLPNGIEKNPNFRQLNFEEDYDCTYFALDIEFTDGSFLSSMQSGGEQADIRDQHGILLTPDEQYNSKTLFPEQENMKIIDLGEFAKKEVKRVFANTPQEFKAEIIDSPEPKRRPIDYVDIRRGTNNSDGFSRGNAFPLIAEPFGFLFAMPFTAPPGSSRPYTYSDEKIHSFGISHIPSPWISDYKFVGSFAYLDNQEERGPVGFKHEDEVALPYLYRVLLENKLQVSITTNINTAIIEYDYSRTDANSIEIIIDNPCPGSYIFETQVEQPTDKKVTLYITQSFISETQAERNFEFISFDAAFKALKNKWEVIFDRFKIEGGSNYDIQTFYSNIYRMYLYPNFANERISEHLISANNGFWDTYRTIWPALFLLEPQTSGDLLKGFLQHYYDSGWVPRWSAPGAVDSMNGTHSDIVFASAMAAGIQGFDYNNALESSLKNALLIQGNQAVGRKGLGKYLELGWVPNSIPEGLSWTLENSFGDYAILEMLKRLIPDSEEMLSQFERRSKNYKNVFCKETGFFMGRDEEGNFSHSAKDFDPRVWGGQGLPEYTETNAYGMRFHPVYDAKGLIELYGGKKELEAALDDYFFAARETAEKEFSGSYGFVIHEQAEARAVRQGMFGMSNQPAHHIPYVYSLIGEPMKTQKIVADIFSRFQVGSEIGQGYLGDEDNGEMSAWFFFAGIGLYPLNPVSAEYIITAPRFKHLEIQLGPQYFYADNQNRKDGSEERVFQSRLGDELNAQKAAESKKAAQAYPSIIIDAPEASRENCIVKSLKVNGKPWKPLTIKHELLAAGAHLEFELVPSQ